MAFFRVFLALFVLFVSYNPVDAAYNADALEDFLDHCKGIMSKHNIASGTFLEHLKEQSPEYEAFVAECIEALPTYGLANGGDAFVQYIKFCIDNLTKLKELYHENIQAYVKFCIEALKEHFQIDPEIFIYKADGKGIVDYLQWCKDLIKNYGAELTRKGKASTAYRNFVTSVLRHLDDFGLAEKYADIWGDEGYPGQEKLEQLITDCLDLLLRGGYRGSWSRYVKKCLQLLGKHKLAAYEFIFEGEGGALIAHWQEKLADILGMIQIKKAQHPFPKKGLFRAEGAEGVVEGASQGQTAEASGSSSSQQGSPDNTGLIIGLLAMVALSLVANILVVALFLKNRSIPERLV